MSFSDKAPAIKEKNLKEVIDKKSNIGIPEQLLPKVRKSIINGQTQEFNMDETCGIKERSQEEVVEEKPKRRMKTFEEFQIRFANLAYYSGKKISFHLNDEDDKIQDQIDWESNLHELEKELDLHQKYWRSDEWWAMWDHAVSEDAHLPMQW